MVKFEPYNWLQFFMAAEIAPKIHGNYTSIGDKDYLGNSLRNLLIR